MSVWEQSVVVTFIRVETGGGEQVDDGLVPRVTKEILNEIKDILQERIAESRNVLSALLLRVEERVVCIAAQANLNRDRIHDPWPC